MTRAEMLVAVLLMIRPRATSKPPAAPAHLLDQRLMAGEMKMPTQFNNNVFLSFNYIIKEFTNDINLNVVRKCQTTNARKQRLIDVAATILV